MRSSKQANRFSRKPHAAPTTTQPTDAPIPVAVRHTARHANNNEKLLADAMFEAERASDPVRGHPLEASRGCLPIAVVCCLALSAFVGVPYVCLNLVVSNDLKASTSYKTLSKSKSWKYSSILRSSFKQPIAGRAPFTNAFLLT